MRLLSFGTVTLPENNGQDLLPIDYRSSLVDLQNGSYDYDGQKSVLRSTTLTRQAVVISSIQSTFASIATEANKGRLILRGKERDATEYLTFAKVARIGLSPNAGDYGCKEALEINFVQDYPFWLHSADVETFLEDGEVLDDYSWNLDGGNKSTSTINGTGATITSDTLTINNTGTAPIYRGYFVLSFQNNYDVNFVKIRNLTNGLELTYNLSISGASDIGDWTLSWLDKTLLTNTSDLDRTGLVLPNNQSDWFRLEIGNNDLQIDLSHNGNTDMTLDIYWSRHYTY